MSQAGPCMEAKIIRHTTVWQGHKGFWMGTTDVHAVVRLNPIAASDSTVSCLCFSSKGAILIVSRVSSGPDLRAAKPFQLMMAATVRLEAYV